MDLDELILSKKALKDKYNRDLDDLHKQYAFSNTIANVGDIIQSNNLRIVVRKISFTIDWDGSPSCLYYGIPVNKDGSENKRYKDKLERIHQTNIIKINGIDRVKH